MSVIDRKNILVTGGAGFLGSHLCDALVRDAHVICLDNFSTSTVVNIEHLLQNPHFEFINHDITKPFDLKDFPELERFHISLQGVQEIYHLACPISKRNFEDFKIATILTNSLGIKNVLDVAVANKARLLYASSSVLYGPRKIDHPFAKESDPCVIDHLTAWGAYEEGKRFSEAILSTYADVYGLDGRIARIFRTYGPRMKLFDGNLLPDMVNAALEGKDVEIGFSSDANIGLCFVTDIVDGLIKQMNAEAGARLLNFGSDRDEKLSAVAEKIIRLVDASSHVRFDPLAVAFIEAPLPDLSLIRHALGWIPLVRLEDGLSRMIDYARSHRQQVAAF